MQRPPGSNTSSAPTRFASIEIQLRLALNQTAETAGRGHVVYGDETYLRPQTDKVSALHAELSLLAATISNNPRQAQSLSQLRQADHTDVVMPDMGGREPAKEARRRSPKLKVLYTTGFSRNAVLHDGELDPAVDLLHKPYTFEQPAQRIRRALDDRAG